MSRLVVLVFFALAGVVGALPAVPAAASGLARPAADAYRAAAAETENADPDWSVVEFTLIEDRTDSNGRWVQTYRMQIKPGGTLAEASELVYGSYDRVNDLFQKIKQSHPELRDAAHVPANLEAEITLDPRDAFVPKDVRVDQQRGATIYSYYNGATRTLYDAKLSGEHKGLSQVIDLPSDRPAKSFIILEDALQREVPAGVRIAYYVFQQNDNLKSVVAEIYGTNSTRAINHFLTQTQWDPNHWPPAQLAHDQRVMIPNNLSYEDGPFAPLDVAAGNPAAGDQLRQQVSARANAGIFAIRRQPYGTVYRVIASDFNLTARQVAVLLYGKEDPYLLVAAAAGFGNLYDLSRNPPEDVRLFGRTFEVAVDYEAESFPERRTTVVDQTGRHVTVVLLNGATVEEWPDQKESGLVRQITMPSGYRKLVYRPNGISALAARVLFTLVSLGQGDGNPQVRSQQEGRFVSSLIWDWMRSVPRQPGDVFEHGSIVNEMTEDAKVDELLEIEVRPSIPDALDDLPFYSNWLSSPFMLGAGAVLVALLVLGTFGWATRRV